MKNLIFCFFLSFYCIGILSASTQRDSIILALEDTLCLQIDSLGIAKTLYDMGERYKGLREYDNALTNYKKALKIRINNLEVEHLDVVYTYHKLGVVYRRLGHYDKALESFEKALEIKKNILVGNDLDVAKICHSMGIVYYTLKNYNQALKYSNQALEIRIDSLGHSSSHVADSYTNISVFYRALANYDKALELNKKALNIRIEKLGERHSDVADDYSNLAAIHHQLGNYDKALELNKKALNIRIEKLGERDYDVAKSYNNISVVYILLGDYQKALKAGENALIIKEYCLRKNHPSIANSYNNLALLHNDLGDYNKALELTDSALIMRIEDLGNEHLDIAESYENKAKIYCKLGKYHEALNYSQQAIRILRKQLEETHPKVAESHQNKAMIYYTIREYDKSLELTDSALIIRIDKLGKNHPYTINSYINAAKTHQALNSHKTADSLWHIVINQSLKRLNDTYLFLPDNQRIEYAKTFKDVYNNFYSFAAKHGDADTKRLAAYLLLNTKSLALDYSISVRKLINSIDNEELKNLHNELNTLNTKISQTELMTDEELVEKDSVLTDLGRQQEDLSGKLLKNKNLKEKLHKTSVTWEDAQNQLKSDEVMLDFVHFYEESDSTWMYYAMLTRKGMSAPQFIRITDQEAIITHLKAEDEYSLPNYIQSEKSRKDLYQKIWQPLADSLKDIKTIHLSPSGLLHRIDFDVLQNEDEDEYYLADQFEFHYYTTMRDFTKREKTNWLSGILSWLSEIFGNKKYKNLLLFGDIAYDAPVDTTAITQLRSGFSSLEFTGGEIDTIAEINIGGTSTKITGNDATEDTLKYHIKNLPPDIIHLAVHGAYLARLDTNATAIQHRLYTTGNPLQRSIIALSGANDTWTQNEYIPRSDKDGILTAYEVSHLDLSKTKLIVLSACETGLGDIHDTEGVLGLQSAFKLAGVEHVVVSLWKVDDKKTQELMVAFYKNLLNKKQDAPTALRNAKAEMREYYNDNTKPADWAGFILVE